MFFYLLLWFILVGKFNIETFLIGLIITSGVYMLSRKYEFKEKKKIFKLYLCVYKCWMYLIYGVNLIKEIILAGIYVASIVLSINPKIDSVVVDYKTDIKRKNHLLMFCNSITLTPGTLTVGVEEDIVKIHCFTQKNANELENNIFERIIRSIELKEEEILNG